MNDAGTRTGEQTAVYQSALRGLSSSYDSLLHLRVFGLSPTPDEPKTSMDYVS